MRAMSPVQRCALVCTLAVSACSSPTALIVELSRADGVSVAGAVTLTLRAGSVERSISVEAAQLPAKVHADLAEPDQQATEQVTAMASAVNDSNGSLFATGSVVVHAHE